jgi:GT2 family glycosyltransferase
MISIIVVAHNKCDLTRCCLEALKRSQISQEFEILLVDNASTEEMASVANEYRGHFRHFRCLRNDLNLPFAAANNAAADQAVGEWLLFVNNDVAVGARTVENLIHPMLSNAGTGVTGARLLYPEGGKVQHAGIEQMLWGYASNYGAGGNPEDPRLCTRRRAFAVTGAMLCTRADLFKRTGGFDEDFCWGYEDLDLCLKAQAAGFDVLYVPEAVGFHWESATLGQLRSASDPERNYHHYRAKWHSMLVEREERYLKGIVARGIRTVLVFGTGAAASMLRPLLAAHGIEIAAFTSSRTDGETRFCDRPVVPLAETRRWGFDALVVGSQYYFEVEPLLARLHPDRDLVFPVVS